MNEYESSEIVKDSKGRQYHIGLVVDDISENIILVGDPSRADLISNLFDTILLKKVNREFVTYTGLYSGIKITVMSTGMGAANTEIAIIELCQLKFPLNIIRCGTCGSLQNDIKIGDLVVSSGAMRLENVTSYYVENSYPAISSYEISMALLKSANDSNVKYHYGITATAAGFYGGQERNIPGFPLREDGLIERLSKQNVKNFEMETSTLLTLANLRGFRAGSICAVVSSRRENKFVAPDKIKDIENCIIKVCINAFKILKIIDSQKGEKSCWIPDF